MPETPPTVSDGPANGSSEKSQTTTPIAAVRVRAARTAVRSGPVRGTSRPPAKAKSAATT